MIYHIFSKIFVIVQQLFFQASVFRCLIKVSSYFSTTCTHVHFSDIFSEYNQILPVTSFLIWDWHVSSALIREGESVWGGSVSSFRSDMATFPFPSLPPVWAGCVSGGWRWRCIPPPSRTWTSGTRRRSGRRRRGTSLWYRWRRGRSVPEPVVLRFSTYCSFAMESEPLLNRAGALYFFTLIYCVQYSKVGTGVPSPNTGGLASRVLDNKTGDGSKMFITRASAASWVSKCSAPSQVSVFG